MYNSKLLLQIGNIPVDNDSSEESEDSFSEEELNKEIYGKDLGIGIPTLKTYNTQKNGQNKSHETILTTLFTHNDEEVYEYYESVNLQLVCLKQKVDKITFIPTLKIAKKIVYHNFDHSDLKKLQNDIKTAPRDSYLVLGLLDFDMTTLPDNFLFYLKNKLMSTFLNRARELEYRRKEKNYINRFNVKTDANIISGNWMMLLYKRPNETMIKDDRNYIKSDVFKNNPKWNKLYNKTRHNLDLVDKRNREIINAESVNDRKTKYKSQGNLVYLGESYSTDIAEIKIDLKKIPYAISQLK